MKLEAVNWNKAFMYFLYLIYKINILISSFNITYFLIKYIEFNIY